ncbi:MAG: hypothetical protein WCO56_29305 [Verrucomicrobiota bacterium]
MTKRFQDAVSFVVMAVLVFMVLSLSHTALTGSSGARIRYLHLHWIVVRQDIWKTSVSHIYIGTLAALIASSLCLTWILLKALKALRHKKSDTAWLIFILVIVIYLLFASMQDFVFT